MPIGVEHPREETYVEPPLEVFLPVMPIGVEHLSILLTPRRLTLSVLTCDADRR